MENGHLCQGFYSQDQNINSRKNPRCQFPRLCSKNVNWHFSHDIFFACLQSRQKFTCMLTEQTEQTEQTEHADRAEHACLQSRQKLSQRTNLCNIGHVEISFLFKIRLISTDIMNIYYSVLNSTFTQTRLMKINVMPWWSGSTFGRMHTLYP